MDRHLGMKKMNWRLEGLHGIGTHKNERAHCTERKEAPVWYCCWNAQIPLTALSTTVATAGSGKIHPPEWKATDCYS